MIQGGMTISLSLGLPLLITACSSEPLMPRSSALNSRHNDEQPALSGNGQFLAFVSNREGGRYLLLYDLRRQQFVDLPQLNRRGAIAANPSLSNTARYIVYISSASGRAELELYDRITSKSEILTRGYRGWVRHPSISPDGRYIAFETGRNGQWDIEVIDRGSNIELDLPNRQR